MKIYEVLTDELADNNEVHRTTEYVSSASIDLVFNHYSKEAKEFDRDLVSIRQVLTVVREIE